MSEAFGFARIQRISINRRICRYSSLPFPLRKEFAIDGGFSFGVGIGWCEQALTMNITAGAGVSLFT